MCAAAPCAEAVCQSPTRCPCPLRTQITAGGSDNKRNFFKSMKKQTLCQVIINFVRGKKPYERKKK